MVNPNSPSSSSGSRAADFIRKYNLGNQYKVKTAAIGNIDASDGERPNPRDFYDIYPVNEINADITQQQIAFKNIVNEKDPNTLDSRILENNVRRMMGEKDWFYENKYLVTNVQQNRKKPQEVDANISTHPTSLVDDCFSHIDFVAIIKNQFTDKKPLPIGFDVTYDPMFKKLNNKFSRIHTYGKSANAPDNFASEFGSYNSEPGQILLDCRYKKGLKIPGFGSVKYFEDKKNIDKPLIEKGRIEIMPKLIIGYDPEIAKKLDRGIDPKELQSLSKIEQNHVTTRYNRAALRAKWCTLLECHQQVDDIVYMINNRLDDRFFKTRPQTDLDTVYEQMTALKHYFDFAMEQANEAADKDEEEYFARQYALEEDEIQMAIAKHSNRTYREYEQPTQKSIQDIGHEACKAYNKK